MTPQHFEQMIQIVGQRMEDSQTRNARQFIAEGQPYTSGRYYVGGPIVTRVTVPASWRNCEAWRNCETISAVLPEHQEIA